MIIVKASKDSEAGKLPSQELLAAMGKFTPELREQEERPRAQTAQLPQKR